MITHKIDLPLLALVCRELLRQYESLPAYKVLAVYNGRCLPDRRVRVLTGRWLGLCVGSGGVVLYRTGRKGSVWGIQRRPVAVPVSGGVNRGAGLSSF